MVRIRVEPIESRGSYRVNKIAWSGKVHRIVLTRGVSTQSTRYRNSRVVETLAPA